LLFFFPLAELVRDWSFSSGLFSVSLASFSSRVPKILNRTSAYFASRSSRVKVGLPRAPLAGAPPSLLLSPPASEVVFDGPSELAVVEGNDVGFPSFARRMIFLAATFGGGVLATLEGLGRADNGGGL
jgi:hypothetical protein